MMADLVFDIGANDGRDTAFYLAKGFRVVAVDADPAMCARIRADQVEAIAAGRLVVANIGIGAQSAVLPFYVNEYAEWSSFRPNSKATSALSHKVIEVQMQPLSRLLADHGTPYYLKIDIEGHELAALRSIDAAAGLPRFLSFEINGDWKTILRMLEGWGFDGFQLVRQGKDFLPRAPVPAREGLDVDQAFTNGHSGCFGADLPDAWCGADALVPIVETAQAEAKARRLAGKPPGWFDIHARRKPGAS